MVELWLFCGQISMVFIRLDIIASIKSGFSNGTVRRLLPDVSDMHSCK